MAVSLTTVVTNWEIGMAHLRHLMSHKQGHGFIEPCLLCFYFEFFANSYNSFSILFKVASLALGQFLDSPDVNELTLKVMGNIYRAKSHQNATKRPMYVCFWINYIKHTHWIQSNREYRIFTQIYV